MTGARGIPHRRKTSQTPKEERQGRTHSGRSPGRRGPQQACDPRPPERPARSNRTTDRAQRRATQVAGSGQGRRKN